jgi:two-component system OmpR family response regulator
VEERKKILIVDDDAEVRQILADKLIAEGFDVIQAVDGETGLQSADAARPDLILLDLIMPKIDGVGVMTKLRENEWGKNEPIIIITNIDPDENTVRAMAKCKPYYFFSKGMFDLDDLVNKIKEILPPLIIH